MYKTDVAYAEAVIRAALDCDEVTVTLAQRETGRWLASAMLGEECLFFEALEERSMSVRRLVMQAVRMPPPCLPPTTDAEAANIAKAMLILGVTAEALRMRARHG